MKSTSKLLALALLCAAPLSLPAADQAPPSKWGDWPKWGDQGDGTYRNLVLPADYSDLDCIRVGDDYYAISSTFQYSPGMVILHSKDLVNWTIAGHAINDLTEIGPDLNWDRMNRYGKGVWAGAIRYAKGRFWVYFGTPDEGYFMTSAPRPEGPWEPLHQVLKSGGWDDCCPFWDDDGQGYFVGTHFADDCKTYIWKLTPDGKDLVESSRTLINQGAHREANKLLKINGTYYHFFSEVKDGTRVVMMQRSKNVMGPYTERRQLTAANRESHEPNQGGIVDTKDGQWFFVTHHGNGDWEGRGMSLLPVTWVDGWPICGKTDAAGSPGLMVWGGKKPLPGPKVTPQSSDDFTSPKLNPQWEWNYQPRADKWSLTKRPGFLRLEAFRPLRPDDLKKAGNTLTQRVMRTSENVVTVQLDPSGMADGQVAGLALYHRNYGTIAVRRENGVLTLESARNQTIQAGPKLNGKPLWLRSEWGLDGVSQFSYSTDGRNFTKFGEPFRFGWDDYRGERIGLFSYNNAAEAGHADFDSFTYRYDAALKR